MSGRLFDPTSDEPFQTRAVLPQMDGREVGGSAGVAQGAASRALLAFSAEMAGLEDARVRAEAAGAEATVRARTTTRLAELRASLAEGDPSTMRARWDAGVARLSGEVLDGIPQMHHRRLRQVTGALASAQVGGVMDLQARRTGDVGRAALLRGVDDLVTAGVSAAEGDRPGVLAQIDATVRAAVAGGLIGAEAGERLRQGAGLRLNREVAREMVRQRRGGPGAVDSLPLPPLPPEDMRMLRDAAADDLAADGADAEQAEQQAASDRDEVVQTVANRALAGDDPPTADEVMALRWDMPPERYDAVLTVSTGRAATRDDPEELDDLTAQAGIAPSAGYRARLDRSLAGGRITRETHRRLTDLDLSMRGSDPASQGRLRERQEIVSALPVDGFDVPGVRIGSFTRIRTRWLDAWEAWSAENPRATPRERDEAMRWVQTRAREDVVAEAVRVLPRAGLRIENGQPPALADIERQERDLLEALDAAQGDDEPVNTAGIADALDMLERWRAVAGMADAARRGAR